MPEFESTKISIKDVPNSNPWAKIESVSDYFNSIDIQDPYTFVIHENDVENTANSGINLDFMPASIYKCISRKQFSIKQHSSESKDNVIGLIQNYSLNGTYVNGKILNSNTEYVLKIGDIIGIAYYSKDMKKMTCPAFKISHYSPFPTLIDSSDLSVKITRTTLKNATFVPNGVLEQVSAHAFDVIQLVAEEVPRSLAGGSRRHVTACDSGPGTDARPARRSLPTPLTHQKDTMTKDKDKCQYKDRDKDKDKRILNPFH